MSDVLTSGRARLGPTTTELTFYWFHRAIAGWCLVFGVFYWVRLIGVYDGPLYRFDLMPVHWQVAAVSLAVLYPFAASGLWMVASWGPVIWFLCAAIETAMYVVFSDLFGQRWEIIAAHIAVIVVYLGFRGAIYFQKRLRV